MNKTLKIIINGPPGAGKDTFVSFVQKYIPETANLSSIDESKEILKLMGWNGKKTLQARQALSDLKMLWSRFNDGPFLNTVDAANQFEREGMKIVFIHCREHSEILRFEKVFWPFCITIYLFRPGNTEQEADIPQVMREIKYDFRILNYGGLKDLEESARYFSEQLELVWEGLQDAQARH